HRPSDQNPVHMLERRIEGRLVKPAVVVDPSPEYRIEHPGEVLQRFVTARVQVPAPQLPPKVAGRLGTCRRTKIDEVLPPAVLRPAGPKRIAQKVEVLLRGGPPPIIILAVDDLGLLRM